MHESDNALDHTRNSRARAAAQAAAETLSVRPTGVVHYKSRGRVLVIGGEEARWLAARLQPPLHAQVLLTEGDDEPGVPTTPLGGRELQISGHLGAFLIELGEHGRHNHETLEVDMVLDLGAEALIQRDLPPPGYWHFGSEAQDLDAATAVVEGMVGTFEKPRYFDYDSSICAHARSGQNGCRQCIDACPAEAIISIGEQVEVNPNLCQGGGICATVCPTGAMRYAYPSPADTGQRVRLMLTRYLEENGSDPVVMFVAEEDAADLPAIPANMLLVVVEELASVGHELWLAALAWGARCVLLADNGSVPPQARSALDRQITITRDLLYMLGYVPQALSAVDTRVLPARCTPVQGLPKATAFAAGDSKRQLAAMAIDHLWSHSTQRPESFALPDGAPYGRIQVDSEKCTLCMSCTSVCPSRALHAGDELPRLVFHESNCVQCGICASACPESAIRLQSRYLADPEARRMPQILHEDQPFCCIECGKPFATRRVLDNILGKLAGHAMFQSERARRRLQMCEDCRVVDAVQDADAMQDGLFKQQSNFNDNN